MLSCLLIGTRKSGRCRRDDFTAKSLDARFRLGCRGSSGVPCRSYNLLFDRTQKATKSNAQMLPKPQNKRLNMTCPLRDADRKLETRRMSMRGEHMAKSVDARFKHDRDATTEIPPRSSRPSEQIRNAVGWIQTKYMMC